MAISDAAGGNPNKIAEASKEVANGDNEAAKDTSHYANAIDHYKNAWMTALAT